MSASPAKTNKFLFKTSLTILLLACLVLFVQHLSKKNTIDTFVVDIETEEEQQEFSEIKVSGNIKGMLLASDNPAVLVRLDYTNANGDEKFKVVSLDYESNFNFDLVTVPSSSNLKISVTSPSYVFYPSHYDFTSENKNNSFNFEASLKEATKSDLSIYGQLIGAKGGGVVYVYGTSSVDGDTIKKIANVNKNGLLL